MFEKEKVIFFTVTSLGVSTRLPVLQLRKVASECSSRPSNAYPLRTSPSDKSPTSTIRPSPLVTGESETKHNAAALLSYESTEYTVFVLAEL